MYYTHKRYTTHTTHYITFCRCIFVKHACCRLLMICEVGKIHPCIQPFILSFALQFWISVGVLAQNRYFNRKQFLYLFASQFFLSYSGFVRIVGLTVNHVPLNNLFPFKQSHKNSIVRLKAKIKCYQMLMILYYYK